MKKRLNKAARIRTLIAAGKTAREAAAVLGVKPQYVHSVLHYERKKEGAPRRKPGRPKKVETITQEAETLPVGNWMLTARYEEPRLTWKQRFSALFTGRI